MIFIKRLKLIKNKFQKILIFFDSSPWLMPSLLLLIGLLQRLLFCKHYPIGFDQVQIFTNARAILDGDLTLVGPRTGPAQMFTGPLIYYLAVPFAFLFSDLVVAVLVPAFISLVTGMCLYFLGKKYLHKKIASLLLFIWAVSPFLVSLDRVFWNPNLTLIASILIFLPLVKMRNKNDRLDLLSLFLGSFLSYQAHFSGFLLVGLGLLTVILEKEKNKIYRFGALLFGMGFSLLPTVIFDLRNNFLNTQGFISLLTQQSDSKIKILFQELVKNFYVEAETLGKIFLFNNNSQTIIVLGLFLLVLGLFCWRKRAIRISYLWLGVIGFAYAFYHGSKPEYYYLIAVLPMLMILVTLLKKFDKKLLKLVLVFVFINSLIINIHTNSRSSGLNIAAISNISSYLEHQQVKDIVYDMPYGSEEYLEYFFQDLLRDQQGKVFHLSYPDSLGFSGVKVFSGITVWADHRSPDANYVSNDKYILGTSRDYSLAQDLYPRVNSQWVDFYRLIENNVVIGSVAVTPMENEKEVAWIQYCKQSGKNNQPFLYVDESYFFSTNNYCLKINLKNFSDFTKLDLSLR